MDLAQLTSFAATARLGSISAAAAELGYSQSAISRQLQALEKEFGAELLRRTARGVRLTDRGRALLPHVREITAALEAARVDVAAGGPVRARLRIGTFPAATATLVAHALADLARTQPDLVIDVRQAPSSVLAAVVAGGDLDGAVVMEGAPRRTRTNLVITDLFVDEMVVVVPQWHPRAGIGVVCELAEFAGDTWVEEEGRPERILVATTARAGWVPRRVRRAPDLAAKLGFVAAGLGVAMMPGLVAGAAPPGTTIIHIADPPRRTVHWITRADRDPELLGAIGGTLRTVAETTLDAPTANRMG